MQTHHNAKSAAVQEYVTTITSELDLLRLVYLLLRQRRDWAEASDPGSGAQALVDLFSNAADDLAAVIETMRAGEALLAGYGGAA